MKHLYTLLLFFYSTTFAFSQQKTFSGTIFSGEDNLGLPGAAVLAKGTTLGTLTDVNGHFSIQLPDSINTLVISYIGYSIQTIPLTGQSVINVVLQPDAKNLKEVVVTALGIKRERKALGYAVQEVSGASLLMAKDPSFINQLEGKVAGLNISATTGGPGSSSRIILRGTTSIGGDNQALVVVDGVPIENNTENTTSQWGGKDFGNGISDINPEDIESISVLKGANAAALYGSMASNGAIVITTKKGASRKGIGISFNSNTTAERAYILTNYQNVYGAGRNGKFEGPWENKNGYFTYNTASSQAFGSWGPKMEGQTIRDWDSTLRSFSSEPDNYKSYFQTGITANNSLALDGGNDKITFRISLSNLATKDIVPHTTLNRTSITVRTTANATEKLSFDVSVSYTNQKAQNRLGLSNSFTAPRNYIMMPRNISNQSLKEHMMDDFGREQTWYTNWNWMSNPFWDYTYEVNDDTRDRILGIASVTYKATNHLNLMLRGNTDFNTTRFNDREAYNGISNSLGSYTNRWKQEKQYNSDFLVTYENKINSKLSYNLNAGGSWIENKYEATSISTSGGLSIPYFYNVQYSNNPTSPSYFLSEKRNNSLYAFAQVSYNRFLYVDITGRNDWSSVFAKGNNSYFYPSLSSGFVFTEALKLNQKILSFGKIRASYAKVGRDTDPYLLSKTYIQQGSFNGAPYANPDPVAPNPGLKPEFTKTFELGTELLFFNGRMGLDFSWYHTTSINQILKVQVAPSSGYSNAVINSGEITNRGYEIQLHLVPVKSKSGFEWGCNLNYAHNRSKVVSLANGLIRYPLLSHWGLTVEARSGEEYGQIVGYGIKRDKKGNKLVDDNGMYIRDTVPKVLGNYNPDFTGGISNELKYKQFQFGFLVDFRVGGQVFSGTNMYGNGYSGNLEATLEGREGWYASEREREAAGITPENWTPTGGYLAEGVKSDGTKNHHYVNPEKYWGQFSEWTNEIHEPYVYDASFVKLREVTIGYSVPIRLIKKLKIKELVVSLTGRNLWLMYSGVPNIDPESSYTNGNGQGYEIYSFPTRKSYGINLRFTL